MPANEEMMLVAKLFHHASYLNKETEYYTAVMDLPILLFRINMLACEYTWNMKR